MEKIPTEKVLMTERESSPDNKTVLKTEFGEPNVQVITLEWWQQALIRGSRVYLQALVGFLLAVGTGAAGAVGVSIPVGDFGALFLSAASMSIAPAAISLIQNAIEILTKLDSTSPEMRA